MKLSCEIIRKIAHGAARVEQVGDAIGLFRFTKEQEKLYREKSCSGFYERTFATAGVDLEFDTDSEKLFMKVAVETACGYRWFTHSVFVDDRRIGEISGFVPEGEIAHACGNFSLGKGMKRVRIVFPWNECSRIEDLELEDGAQVIPIPKKRKMLFFGDSITQGYTTWLPENSYAFRIAQCLNADARNKAIGGECYWPELADTAEDLQPDLVLIAYGANDWNERAENEFAENARQFCVSIRKNYPCAQIVVITPIWSKIWKEKQMERWPFENMAKHLCTLQDMIDNLVVVQGTDLVPPDTACFAEDRVHPNDIGFAHYAQNLKNNLTNIMD